MANEPALRFRFARDQRIKYGRDFNRAKTEGQRLARGSVLANWVAASDSSRSRLGVIVSKKIGNAPARTRVRRLLREVFRLHQHELNAPIDLVLVARQSIARKNYGEVETDVLSALRAARLLKDI